MAKFEQMVKMMTSEPSVVLKLKRGGNVKSKVAAMTSGHQPMAMPKMSMAAEPGKAPKRPPMSARMKAMNPNMYAKGGSINEKGATACAPKMASVMTRGTAGKGSAGSLVSKISTSKPDRSPAKTGDVKKGNGGGFKDGGPMQHKAVGGTVSGNEKAYANTKMNTAHANTGSKTTGDVKMGNGGGFKCGGNVDSGGAIDKFVTRTAVKGGDSGNRPASTAKPGVTGTTTGKVKLGNAGGYKDGGNAVKKSYATGGEVNSMGDAKKMPARLLSQPVANTKQSGTYKSGGEVG
jgi:hypothetical protein